MKESATKQVALLVGMTDALPKTTIEALRGADTPDPRTRIDKIRAAYPLDYEAGVTSNGGNSGVYTFNVQGRRAEQFKSGVRVNYLGQHGDDFKIALYPYGIVGVTEEGRPIFEDPETSQRASIAVEYHGDPLNRVGLRVGLLQKRIDPLFNVDPDGKVFARISDQPTPAELGLLYDILDQFEAVTQPQS